MCIHKHKSFIARYGHIFERVTGNVSRSEVEYSMSKLEKGQPMEDEKVNIRMVG